MSQLAKQLKQLRHIFRKEVRLRRAHFAGLHQKPVITCDLCQNRELPLTARIKAMKNA